MEGIRFMLDAIAPLVGKLEKTSPLNKQFLLLKSALLGAQREHRALGNIELEKRLEIDITDPPEEQMILATASVGTATWKYDPQFRHPPVYGWLIPSKAIAATSLLGRRRALYQSLGNLRGDAQIVSQLILGEADDLKDKDEKLAHYAWWISGCLFALGWTIGLVGKLYGVPGAAGGD